MDKKFGGPAFPRRVSVDPVFSRVEAGQVGLSTREYFAAAAITGLVAKADTVGCSISEEEARLLAQSALRIADAMIIEGMSSRNLGNGKGENTE